MQVICLELMFLCINLLINIHFHLDFSFLPVCRIMMSLDNIYMNSLTGNLSSSSQICRKLGARFVSFSEWHKTVVVLTTCAKNVLRMLRMWTKLYTSRHQREFFSWQCTATPRSEEIDLAKAYWVIWLHHKTTCIQCWYL
jgi:hypothetical protein